MALTQQEIFNLASQQGGGQQVFDKVQSGELSLDQVRGALGNSAVDNWLSKNNNSPAPTPPVVAPPNVPTQSTNNTANIKGTNYTLDTAGQNRMFQDLSSGKLTRADVAGVMSADDMTRFLRTYYGEAQGADVYSPPTATSPGGAQTYSDDQIFKMGEQAGGGYEVLSRINSGQISIDQAKRVFGGQAVDNWLAQNNATQQSYTGQQLFDIASKPGGASQLFVLYQQGKVTLDDLRQNVPEERLNQWLNQNTTFDPATNTYTPTVGGSFQNNNPQIPGGSQQPGTQQPGTNSPGPITGRIPGVNLPLDRDVEALELRQQAAQGNVNVPGANMQAIEIPTEGTISSQEDIQQIAPIDPVTGQPIQNVPVIETTTVDQTATAQTPQEIATSTMEAVEAEAAKATEAAQGTISPEAIAEVDFERSAGTTAEAATVEVDDSMMMEAVLGTMPPEALAEAATVAGLEAARIDRAKQQLRKAGLSEEDIAELGNDPAALELRLTDFTEEQRGIIGGLPEEALVSTQMEQLLAGLESGEVPLWAQPAVSAVESMLARRGLRASSIGRADLANAIIQSAFPIAQSNAQSIKESVMQQKGFEQQAALAEAQFKQQTALQNAQNIFNMEVRNLDAQQQANLVNSQFLQTVAITDANNRQQTAIQNAINLTNLDMAELDSMTRLAVENAKSFLQMDLTNLSNEQQARMIDAQYEQQRLLSNAAAQNAARQFNAASENQTQQFMAGLKAQIDQFNATQKNSVEMFNATEANKIAAQNANNQLAVDQFNSQLLSQIAQFNAQMEMQRTQWNAANAQAIEQSNVQWRRQANTANTAAQNAINQQNVQNAFSLTAQAQAALWQELRDAATFAWQSGENREDREAQLYASAIGNEAAASHNYEHTTHLVNLARSFFGG